MPRRSTPYPMERGSGDPVADAQVNPSTPETDDLYESDVEYLGTSKGFSSVTDPYARYIDLETKAGMAIFKEATYVPRDMKPLDLVIAKADAWWNRFLNKKHQVNWKVTHVPTSGTGAILPPPPTGHILRDPRNMVDLHDFKDVLTYKDANNVSMKHITNWASWYMGGEDQLLAERPGTEMTFDPIDVNKPGIVGEVNRYKNELRIRSNMLFIWGKNNVSTSSWDTIWTQRDKFQYWSDEELRYVYDGLTVLKMMLEMVFPLTRFIPHKFEDELKTITLAGHNNDFAKMVSRMQFLMQRIHEQRGTEFCTEYTWLENFFRAISGVKNETFRYAMINLKTNWMQHAPGTDKTSIVQSLLATYKNLEHSNDWKEGSVTTVTSNRIVALETAHRKLKEDLAASNKKLEAYKSGKSTVNPPNTDKKGVLPAWRTDKKGEFVNEPETGRKHVWCPTGHGPNKDIGMYMAHPHDHDEWQIKKEKRKSEAAKKHKGTGNDGGDSNKKARGGKLVLANETRAALTTAASAVSNTLSEMGCSNGEIGIVIDAMEKSVKE